MALKSQFKINDLIRPKSLRYGIPLK